MTVSIFITIETVPRPKMFTFFILEIIENLIELLEILELKTIRIFVICRIETLESKQLQTIGAINYEFSMNTMRSTSSAHLSFAEVIIKPRAVSSAAVCQQKDFCQRKMDSEYVCFWSKMKDKACGRLHNMPR